MSTKPPTYNPPPNWPPSPPGWTPPPGWQPDPAWGPAPAGWQLWKQQKSNRGKITLGVIGALVLIIVIAGVAGGSKKKTASPTAPVVASASSPTTTAPVVASASSPTTTAPATVSGPTGSAADVTLKTCDRDAATGWYTADLVVLNHSSKTSNYIIEIGVQSADGATKYDSLLASVDNLSSGQNSPQQAQGLSSVPAGAVCTIDSVTRYASS